jgi:hypothetical protein
MLSLSVVTALAGSGAGQEGSVTSIRTPAEAENASVRARAKASLWPGHHPERIDGDNRLRAVARTSWHRHPHSTVVISSIHDSINLKNTLALSRDSSTGASEDCLMLRFPIYFVPPSVTPLTPLAPSIYGCATSWAKNDDTALPVSKTGPASCGAQHRGRFMAEAATQLPSGRWPACSS